MSLFRHIILLTFIVVFAVPVWGQKGKSPVVELNNGSFEGYPHDAVTPSGWKECGIDSSPDILPGPWGVYQKPTHGNTYLGLITRENKSWEALGQKLQKPLKKYRCYKFTVDLSTSPAYAGYSKPVRLRIWASKTLCERSKLIANSPTIDHYEWKTYEFMFSTEDEDYNYIIIEAYYKEPSIYFYRGNLLIDNISAFEPCDRA